MTAPRSRLRLTARCAITVALSATALLAATPSAHALSLRPSSDWVSVYPTGVPSVDGPAVQEAVNLGGKVLLRSRSKAGAVQAFDFGGGSVQLTADVAIAGEGSLARGDMTTIRRGNQPFRSAVDVQTRDTVTGIHFDDPTSAAVLITSSRGFTFSNNVVTDVVGAQYSGYSKGQAVWITQGTSPGQIIGTMTITGNLVERVHADLSYGVALAGLSARAIISGNTFLDTKDTGVLAVLSAGDLTVTDNVIDGGAPEPGFDSAGNGIAVGLTPGALDIERNTVICTNPEADGIAVEGLLPQDAIDPTLPVEAPRAAVVRNNTVTMHGSTLGALSVYGEITRAQIDGNRVIGDAAYAMQVSPIYGDEVSYGSTFLRNKINGFRASAADVYFSSIAVANTVIGKVRTVIDEGQLNRVNPDHRRLHVGAVRPASRLLQQVRTALS